MTNIYKAANVIGEMVGGHPSIKYLLAAEALAAEGLLMPELPKPIGKRKGDIIEWEANEMSILAAKNVVGAGRVGLMSPSEARDLAIALLAAANRAEKKAGE